MEKINDYTHSNPDNMKEWLWSGFDLKFGPDQFLSKMYFGYE